MKSERRRLAGTIVVSVAIGAFVGAPLASLGASVAHKIDGSKLKNNSVTGKQVKESTLGTVPRAKSVKALPALKWKPVTLLNGWTPGTSDVGRAPAVALGTDGIVHFRGSVVASSPDDDIIFQVPPAMRPTSGSVLLPVDESFANTGRLEVTTQGYVGVVDDPEHEGTAKGYTSLEGIEYSLG